jgi:hypothetical protein
LLYNLRNPFPNQSYKDNAMTCRNARLLACFLLAIALAACGTPAAVAPIPTPAPWREFSAAGASLWLPETYEALDLGAGVDQRIAKLKQFGGSYARTAQITERSRGAFALWAFDTRVGYRSCAATVGVIPTRQVSAALTLDAFIVEVIRQLPALAGEIDVQLIKQDTVALETGSAARLQLEFPGACRKALLYTVRRADRFWMVVYAADAKEFELRLPSFERSIATFSVDQGLRS